jgi:hypothetical protein
VVGDQTVGLSVDIGSGVWRRRVDQLSAVWTAPVGTLARP